MSAALLTGISSAATDSEIICKHFASFRKNADITRLERRSVEKRLGEVCTNRYPSICGQRNVAEDQLYAWGLSKNDPIVRSLFDGEWVVHASLIDIDNDGKNELRLFTIAGTARCTYSYFFRMAPGRPAERLEGDYEVLREEARYCDGGIAFLRHAGKNYTIEAYRTIDTVWRGDGARLLPVCSY